MLTNNQQHCPTVPRLFLSLPPCPLLLFWETDSYNVLSMPPIYSLFALVSECWDCRCVSLYLASYFIFFKVYFILLNYVCLWVSLPPLVLAPLPRLGHGVGVLLPIHAGVLAGVVCR